LVVSGWYFSASTTGRRAAVVCFAVVLCLLNAVPAFALDPSRLISQYGHRAWKLQDGVLPGAPTAMAQTADGYIWIGTRSGLIRFDGVRFVPFTPGNGQALHSNRILSLRGSTDGSLWIGARRGLERWYRGHLTYYADAPSAIMAILEDRAGKIWFTRTTIHDDRGPLCEVSGDRTVCHGVADGVPINVARELVSDRDDNLWTVSENTLMRWRDGKSRTWLPPGFSPEDAKVQDVVQSVALGTDGSVWVGAMETTRGLGLLRLEGDRLQPYVSPGLDGRTLAVSQVLVDRQNTLWIGSQAQGLYRLRNGAVSHFRKSDGLSGDTVQNLFEDREGTLWVLTTQGVDAFRDLRVASIGAPEGLQADLANAVLAASDGTVWINNWHSLDAWRDGKVTSLNARNGLPGDQVSALLEDRDKKLWVGIDQGLTVFENGRFTPIRQTDGSQLGYVQSIVADRAGDVWAVTNPPVMLYRIRQRKVIEKIPRSTIPFAYGAIAADPQDGLWLPLSNGDLARYRGGRLEVFEFHREPNTGTIVGLVAYPDGSIVGATSIGLVGWRGGKTQTMSAENGLPCTEIHSLLRDRNDGLWLYAACGVVFVASDQLRAWWQNPHAALKFRLLDAFDGAQPARGNMFPKASTGPDGRLWFANASVVQFVDPARLRTNTMPPPVKIEQLLADHQPVPLGTGLRLAPNLRDLQIDYTGLSFVVPGKVSFRYRLLGQETEWQDVGTRRQAFYTDLPPGDYVFQVTASNEDGVWNPTGASLGFSIAPTFYQTRIFTALCVIAVLLAAWLLYLLRVNQIESRMRLRLEERIEERERIARELHDTLLQGVLSASLQLSVANSQIAADAPAKNLVERILHLLRQVTDEGRNAVRGLRTREHDALERALAQVPQDLSLDTKVEYRLLVEGSPRALRPAVRDEVYRIAREALANAFRHSQASVVETVLEYSRHRFHMAVRDDGCGMDPDVLQSGRDGHWGLSGMRERATRIGARLRVLSAPGAGTEICLAVPAATAFEGVSQQPWTDWLSRLYRRSGTE
jgi:signal transduction histidine kinase/ligand-binding sensor domain-containing protein